MNRENQSTILQDGRRLGYAEYGDPKGKPLFFFHGWPGSRFAGALLDQTAKKLHIRLVSVDRPGRGLSNHQPNRTLLDWPDDIEQLANKLELKKFSVMGVSGGGPYALACDFKLSHRLNKVGVVCGIGPIVPFSVYPQKSISLRDKLYYRLLPKGIITIPIISYLTYIGVSYGYSFMRIFWLRNKPISDKQAFSDLQISEMFRRSALESLRPPAPGLNQDYLIYCHDWGFDLKKIKALVYLWHGELDRNVPIWMAQYVAKQLSNCKATFYKDMGHYLWKHQKDILQVFV